MAYSLNPSSDNCYEGTTCLVNKLGIQPTVVGKLPTQLAAMNMTNINPQLLTIEAFVTKKKEHIYQAAMLDPHTGSELSIDEIEMEVLEYGKKAFGYGI